MIQTSILRIFVTRFIVFSWMSIYYIDGHAQVKLTSAFFERTVWASNNAAKNFYVLDTIKLLKLPNDKMKGNGSVIDLADYFNSDFVTISFYKNSKLTISFTDIEAWTISTKQGKYKWKVIESTQKLKLLFNNKLVGLFKPIGENKIKVKSAYAGIPPIETVELIMLRISAHTSAF